MRNHIFRNKSIKINNKLIIIMYLYLLTKLKNKVFEGTDQQFSKTVFVKTIIRMDRKPRNSESASSKTLNINLYNNKLRKRKTE